MTLAATHAGGMAAPGAPTKGERIAVAMSGGVDSLCAAGLLLERGLDVIGVHMRIPTAVQGGTPTDSAALAEQMSERERRLRELARQLGIELAVFDLRTEFERMVIRPFVASYLAGRTPNPCVICNPQMKFGLLLDAARRIGAQRLATGHYARIEPGGGDHNHPRLLRGRDRSKDQSYFLHRLTPPQLAAALFPLGDRTKADAVEWARARGLETRVERESQEICFLPNGGYREFLETRASLPPEKLGGPITDMEGRVLGEHRGLFAYTVGQRRGLGLPSHAPYYVVALDVAANAVRVGREADLYRSRFRVEDVNWVSIDPPKEALRADVRIRYRHRESPARIDRLSATAVRITLDKPQRAVTPGQSAVFYDGEEVLGGGIITESTDAS